MVFLWRRITATSVTGFSWTRSPSSVRTGTRVLRVFVGFPLPVFGAWFKRAQLRVFVTQALYDVQVISAHILDTRYYTQAPPAGAPVLLPSQTFFLVFHVRYNNVHERSTDPSLYCCEHAVEDPRCHGEYVTGSNKYSVVDTAIHALRVHTLSDLSASAVAHMYIPSPILLCPCVQAVTAFRALRKNSRQYSSLV